MEKLDPEDVVDAASLAKLLEALGRECAKRDWTNAELSAFLEASAAWLADSDGYYAARGEEARDLSPWRLFADMLMAARFYE